MQFSSCGFGVGFNSPSGEPINFEGSTADDGFCSNCASGRFKSTSTADRCLIMTVNTCTSGSAFSSPSKMADPTVGATANDGVCNACPSNSYKMNEGPTTCDQCPTNSLAPDSSGGTSIDVCKCIAGYTASNVDPSLTNATQCYQCPENTYKNTIEHGSCTQCPIGSTSNGAIGGATLASCKLNLPSITTTVDHGTAMVQITHTNPNSHACYTSSDVLEGRENSPTPAECGSQSNNFAGCNSPSILYENSIKITTSIKLSIVSCSSSSNGMTGSDLLEETIGIGSSPRVELTEKTPTEPSYATIVSDDPTPDKTLCYSIQKQPSGVMCDGQNGQCNLLHSLPFTTKIPIDNTMNLHSVTCVLNHAPSAVTSMYIEVFAELPSLTVTSTGGGNDGGESVVDISTSKGPSSDPTNVEDPIICYTTASTTATATPIPICLAGNTTTTCGANSNLFLSSLILKETTTIFARTCQHKKSSSSVRKLKMIKTEAPSLVAVARPPNQTPIDVTIRNTNSNTNENSWICYRLDGVKATCSTSNTLNICTQGSEDPVLMTKSLVIHGVDTLITAKACTNLNDASTDTNSISVIGVESTAVELLVRFSKIPEITTNDPKLPPVQITIDYKKDRRERRRRNRRLGQKQLCYTIGTKSNEPTCNDRGGCSMDSMNYDGPFNIDTSTIIRAVHCGDVDIGEFNSNVTLKQVIVPSVPPKPTVVPPTTTGNEAGDGTSEQNSVDSNNQTNSDNSDNDMSTIQIQSVCIMWGPICWFWWILIFMIVICSCCCFIFITIKRQYSDHLPLDAKKSMPYVPGEMDADRIGSGSGSNNAIAVANIEMTSNPGFKQQTILQNNRNNYFDPFDLDAADDNEGNTNSMNRLPSTKNPNNRSAVDRHRKSKKDQGLEFLTAKNQRVNRDNDRKKPTKTTERQNSSSKSGNNADLDTPTIALFDSSILKKFDTDGETNDEAKEKEKEKKRRRESTKNRTLSRQPIAKLPKNLARKSNKGPAPVIPAAPKTVPKSSNNLLSDLQKEERTST